MSLSFLRGPGLLPRCAALVASAALASAALSHDAYAAGVPLAEATPAQKQSAQLRYEQGAAHFNQRRFAEAAEEFRASYEIVASPNSHLMLARALRESGRLAEAYTEIEAALAEATDLAAADARYGPTRAMAERDLAALRSKVALVTITVTGGDPTAKVTMGGVEVPSSKWGRPIAVQPGPLEIVAFAGDEKRVTKELTANAGSDLAVTIDLPLPPPPPPVVVPVPEPPVEKAASVEPPPEPTPAPPPPEPARDREPASLRPWAAAAGGIGLAGIVVFGVAGSMNRQTFEELEHACAGNRCPPDRQDDIDRGRREQTIANVGLAVGLAGIGLGVTLFAIDTVRRAPPSGGVTSARVFMGPGSIAVRGGF